MKISVTDLLHCENVGLTLRQKLECSCFQSDCIDSLGRELYMVAKEGKTEEDGRGLQALSVVAQPCISALSVFT